LKKLVYTTWHQAASDQYNAIHNTELLKERYWIQV